LPVRARPAIYAARLLYAAIGSEMARRDYDGVTSRSVVPAAAKLRLLLRLPALVALPAAGLQAPALAQNRFLLEAVRRQPAPPAPAPAGPLAQARRNINWVLDLFVELDRRERERPVSLAGRRTPG
jgi:phytoene synthase